MYIILRKLTRSEAARTWWFKLLKTDVKVPSVGRGDKTALPWSVVAQATAAYTECAKLVAVSTERGSAMHAQLRYGFVAAAMLLSLGAAAEQSPSCMPRNGEICAVMSTSDFLNAYREAYEVKLTPRDASQDIRRSLRRAASGAGHASPAALGQQVEAALDTALARMKPQLCNGTQAKGADLPAAAAGGFAAAGRALGVSLEAALLGGITGAFVGSVEPPGPRCLCGAPDFRSVPAVCGP